MPRFLISSEIPSDSSAGKITCRSIIFTITIAGLSVADISWYVISCPTSPLVHIPEPVALFVILNTRVPTGPSIADEMIAGSHMTGFFIMFGT